MNIKQMLVVRKDLNMRKGKIAAQCAHASMGAILSLCNKVSHQKGQTWTLELEQGTELHDWLTGKFTKVCVSVNSESELLELTEKAKKAGLIHCLIQDSGLTEFAGIPTYTVLAVGPANSEDLTGLTGHLSLL